MRVIDNKMLIPGLDWLVPGVSFADKYARIVGRALVDNVDQILLAIIDQQCRQPQKLGRVPFVTADTNHIVSHSFMSPNIDWSVSVGIAIQHLREDKEISHLIEQGASLVRLYRLAARQDVAFGIVTILIPSTYFNCFPSPRAS